jgi:hypothetical protein
MALDCTVNDVAGVSKGDAVCLVGWDAGPAPRPQVARATASALLTSRTILGVAQDDAPDGSQVVVLVAGDAAPNSVTMLGAGASRIIVTDVFNTDATLQCKLKRIDDDDGGAALPRRDVYVVGTCDAEGNVTILPHHSSQELGSLRAFNVKAYGAVPDGKTPCDEAFKKMFAAMRATVELTAGPQTALGISELGAGQFKLEDNLILPGDCILTGVLNVQGGATGSTQLVFDAGMGIVIPSNIDIRRGQTAGATVRNLHVACSALAIQPWTPKTLYNLGDAVLLPHDHEHVYECVKAGTSQKAPYPARAEALAALGAAGEPKVPAGTFVVPDTFDGHYYQSKSTGAPGAADPFDPQGRSWVAGRRTADGGVVWQETGLWPGLTGATLDALCLGFPTKLDPVLFAPDPRVVWTPGQDYDFGAVVLVPDGKGGVRTDAVWALLGEEVKEEPFGEGGVAGGGPPGFPGDGWNPLPGSKTNDGTLTWTAIGPDPLLPVVWKKETIYPLGVKVLAPDGAGGINADAVWTLLKEDHPPTFVQGKSSPGPLPWNPVLGSKTMDGDLTWTAVAPESPLFWKAGETYGIGVVVQVPDGAGGVREDALWTLSAEDGAGGVAGPGPAGGVWDAETWSKTNDGNLVWMAIRKNHFYFWYDNDCVWIARAHAGIHARVPCTLENLLVTGATTAKVQIRATSVPGSNANDWRATNLALSGGSGPGFVVSGSNANAGIANGVQFFGTTGTDVNNPPLEWDYGFRDGSQLACTWLGCHVEVCGGYGYLANGALDPAWLGCYSEGNAGTRTSNGVIAGGSLSANPQLTADSFPVVLAGQSCQNLYTANNNESAPADKDKAIFTVMGSTDRPLRAFIPFGIYAGVERAATGWGWSTELNAKDTIFKLGASSEPGKEGWWIWGHDLQTNGSLYASYAISGPTATPLRDFAGGPAGSFWITQPYLFLGGPLTEPNCIKLADAPPVVGDWRTGDIVWNTNPAATGYAGWICTEGGRPGIWAKYGRLESMDVALALSADFTTNDDRATPTALTFPVKSGEVWAIDLLATAQCDGAGGLRYAVAAPAGSTVEGWLDSTADSLATRVLEHLTDTALTAPVHTVANKPAPDRLSATVKAGADGAITIQAASLTNGQTTTIAAGATLRARRVDLVPP